MTSATKRYLPNTIMAQLTMFVISAVFVGVLLTVVALTILVGGSKIRMDPEIKAAAEAARIATIVRRAERTSQRSELADVISGAQSPEARIQQLPVSRLPGFPTEASGYTHRISESLHQTWHLNSLATTRFAGWTNAIAVDIGLGRALVFQECEYQALETFITVQAAIALSIVSIVVIAVSIYAIWWITKPLSSMADATRAFGRTLDDDRPLDASGAAEIAQVAEAINDMRKRIRKLVDERTRMLAAISHDLRTPLTRLRLRSDRLSDPATCESMLRDINAIDTMIREAMAYLRDGKSSESIGHADLPSILLTICNEYSDIGRDVFYDGPDRFIFACRAHALTRAITNVIDNGVKHGTRVKVTLVTSFPETLIIEISDNGPGIPPELREKVFEPFFKADSARSALQSGFGLGLSIARDIVESHGGCIYVSDNVPRGLLVRMSFDLNLDEKSKFRVSDDVRPFGLTLHPQALPTE